MSAPVLILDDALASVDNNTAAAILDSIRAQDDRTIVMISHQLSAAAACDRILVMDNGRIVQQGHQRFDSAARGLQTALGASTGGPTTRCHGVLKNLLKNLQAACDNRHVHGLAVLAATFSMNSGSQVRCTLTFGDIYGQVLAWMAVIFVSLASGLALMGSSRPVFALVGVGLILVLSLPFLLFAFVTTLLNHIQLEPQTPRTADT